jgi:hypothetical protein
MGVVIESTSRSNSSRRCVRDLSHQANHGYFGQLEAQATRSGLFFVYFLKNSNHFSQNRNAIKLMLNNRSNMGR